MKKRLSILMTMILLVTAFTMIPMQTVEAKGKVKLSTTKKTLQIGKTYTLTLKNAKNVKWKSGNKTIVTVKKKCKNKAVIRAKVAGSGDYHGETIVHAGDTYYLVTTGYKEPRPRFYVVTKIETDDIEAYCKGKGVPFATVK